MSKLFYHIGATAKPETAFYPEDAWHSLFDAIAHGDGAEVERIIRNTTPTMLPIASMRPLAAENFERHADQFWRKYGERSDSPKPAKRGETEVSVAPNRSSGEVNEVLRRITEGQRK